LSFVRLAVIRADFAGQAINHSNNDQISNINLMISALRQPAEHVAQKY
jgi:hypothetical protein